jgi:hypothetical protein
LAEFRRFSLHLQNRDTTIMDVGAYLQMLVRALTCMKDTCGETLKIVMEATEKYQGDDNENESNTVLLPSNTVVKRPSEKEKSDFDNYRKQFLQGFIDNIIARFPDTLIKTVDVLNTTTQRCLQVLKPKSQASPKSQLSSLKSSPKS